MSRFTSFLALLIVAAACSAARSGEVAITLPTETATYKPNRGVELAQTNCTVCHSAEYVLVQPRMPRKFWEATVKKMREKFGAPIAEDAVPGLLEYLTGTYGTP